ncbi:prepilin peptidase [Micromonospora sp. WMMD714]|uniref:prepilin peptidase n=1 Tax=Micromonospora sp. WMMD714 TaxID=3016097 RepID=UPI00249C6E28|nr:prepilin peptidase [Micromonospora sp. WMMD714]WFE63079.1 prepilin peptidase [Micromonospora sp. WMMD714]
MSATLATAASTPAGPVVAVATLGALVGLAAPRIARAFPPPTPPVPTAPVPTPPVPTPPVPTPPVPTGPAEPVPTAPAEPVPAEPVPAEPEPAEPVSTPPVPAESPSGLPVAVGSLRVAPIGVAAVGTVVFGGLAAVRGAEPALPAFLLVAAVGLVLAVVDVTSLRLPDPLVGAAALGGGVALTGAAVAAGAPGRLLLALVGAVLSGLLYVVLALLPRSRLGFGDVKLAAALGLPLGWLGWSTLWLGLLLPHLLNGVLVLALLATGRVRRDTALPFGPALLTGAWLAVLLA